MPSTNTPFTPKRLRRLLLSRRLEDAAQLQQWLDHPPPDAPDPTSALAHLAKRATSSEEATVYATITWLARIVFSLLLHWLAIYGFGQTEVMVTGLLITLLIVAIESDVRDARQGAASRRAALLLAKRGDERAVQYLANLWTPCPQTRREAAFNANVSRELTRLLSERQGSTYDRDTEKALRRLVARAFPTRKIALLRRLLRRSLVLDEANTDVLLSVVRHLAPRPTAKVARVEPALDHATLQQVAATSRMGEHHALLNETATALLQRAQGRTP